MVRINKKLDNLDMLIDCAEIRNLSERAYATGKISKKVIKKWHKRSKKFIEEASCSYHGDKHAWIPAKVLKDTPLSDSFWWICRKCRCITEWVWTHELDEPMLSAYREHTREYNHDDGMDKGNESTPRG